MSIVEALVLTLLAFAAGIINTVAGGGSILLVPTMIFLGIPALSANASLRPAILAQGIFGLLSFRREGVLNESFLKRTLPLALAAVPSAVAAAYLVSRFVSQQAFELALASVMLILALVTLRKTKAKPKSKPVPTLVLVVIFLAIGFYGGFIQIGVGFLLASALVLSSWSRMAEIHAAKVCIVFCYTIASLPVFLSADQIVWSAALPLILGQSLGGFIGARWASRLQDHWLRSVHVAFMTIFAMVLIWRACS